MNSSPDHDHNVTAPGITQNTVTEQGDQPNGPQVSFEKAWAGTGYDYGKEALDNVRLGWELAVKALGGANNAEREGTGPIIYLLAAQHIAAVDGELEFDEGARVSDGSDPGAYVQAWSWVGDEMVASYLAQTYDRTVIERLIEIVGDEHPDEDNFVVDLDPEEQLEWLLSAIGAQETHERLEQVKQSLDEQTPKTDARPRG